MQFDRTALIPVAVITAASLALIEIKYRTEMRKIRKRALAAKQQKELEALLYAMKTTHDLVESGYYVGRTYADMEKDFEFYQIAYYNK